jgi:OOP family OmpA-OmpF porin
MKKFVLLTVLFILGSSLSMEAQFLDRLAKKAEEKAKREAEERAERRVEKGIDKVYDKTEEGIDESVKGDGESADKENQETTDETDESSDKSTAKKAKDQTPGLQSYSKFDFIPGEKIIFFDDFSQDAVGDFPVLWNTDGSAEVMTNNLFPGNWVKITNNDCAVVPESVLTLPENYTIEFDVIPQKDPDNFDDLGYHFYLLSTSKPNDVGYGLARPGDAAIKFTFDYNNYYFTYFRDESPSLSGNSDKNRQVADTKYHISIWVQKERIRLYQNEVKLWDLPKAISKNYKYNMIRFEKGVPMFSNVRIAIGNPDMRSKLITEGKLVSYGIYFDVNKDIVKPESYGTLKEIAAVLNENPDVKVKIVGHTDSDGADASNMDLSKRRGEAVKNALVKDFGIDASRLESDGAGESQPIAKNDTSANKALNRRVEFTKL